MLNGKDERGQIPPLGNGESGERIMDIIVRYEMGLPS